MKKHQLSLLLLPLCLFISFTSLAQNGNKIDSLTALIRSAPDDSNKVKLYIKLLSFSTEDTTDHVLHLYDDALKLAANINDERGRGDLYNSLGSVYMNRSDLDNAIKYYEISLDINQRINAKRAIAINNNNLGRIYKIRGQILIALDYFLTALRIFDELDLPQKSSSIMMTIGNIYADDHKPDKAIKYYLESLAIKEKLNDKQGIASNLVNIGSFYYDTKDYAKALQYFTRALSLSKEIRFDRGVFVSLNNIGEIYYKKKNWKKCLAYMMESLKIRETEGNKIDLSLGNSQIGNVYIEMKDYAKAAEYLNKGLALANETKAYEALAVAHDGLSRANEKMGHTEQANENLHYFMQFKDSILNENTSNTIAELETKYQTEKKDLQIKQKSLELENASLEISKKHIQVIVLAITILMIMILGYLFYTRYRLKQKAIMNETMLRQQELRNKAIIEAEEKERIRIAKDLHDGLGQQLSAVKMYLSAFEAEVKLSTVMEEDKVKNLLTMVDEAVKEVRSISHNMMPNALIRSGLSTALREFINKISSTGALKIDLEIIGLNERMESTTETVLYRVLQECISNIVKHAKASKIGIQLVKHTTSLNLIIEDNGVGFDSSKINDFTGIGLKNIISRVQFLNGNVEFDSFPGNGTTVVIDIPL
jgi:two-component system NarL family sensor kinase